MNLYLSLKWLHILSATLLFGTGLGIAFFMWMAHRARDLRVIAATSRIVVIADAWFTAPAVIVQLVTGLWMVDLLGLSLRSTWIGGSLLLFVAVGACWLPVVWLQWRVSKVACAAVQSNSPLPGSYYSMMRWWFWLGWPAFIAVIGIFWMMVAKPA